MSTIQMECTGQKLKLVDTPEIYSGSVNCDFLEVAFCSQWKNFTKTAVFYIDEKTAYHQLMTDNKCVIPHEVLAKKAKIHFGIYGVYEDKVRTSEIIAYSIGEGAITEGSLPSDPTPDIYEQILSELAEIKQEKYTLEVLGVTATPEELNSLEGISGNVQNQINEIKDATGSGSSIVLENTVENNPFTELKLYGKTTQDGVSVGDSGSYSVDVYGKNLFDINGNVNIIANSGAQGNNNSVSGNILTAGVNGTYAHGQGQKIKIGVGNTVTFSAKILSFGSGEYGQIHIYEDNKMKKYVDLYTLNEIGKITYTATSEYVVFSFGTVKGINAQYTDIQVEIGTEVTPYEPYKPKQSLTLTDTLRGVGGTADEKDFAKGVKTQRINEVSGANGFYFSEDGCVWVNLGTLNGVYGAEIISTHAYSCFFNGTGNSIKISGFSSQAEWESFVATNDIKFQYALAEPIETPLSETELSAFASLHTNNPKTTIISEANMDVIAPRVKMPFHWITEIQKLKQAIITLGGTI